MVFSGKTNEFLKLELIGNHNRHTFQPLPESLAILWIRADHSVLKIDGIYHTFSADQVICFTEFHKVEILNLEEARLVQFNRPFYCIKHHDDEVSCKGLLFYGASSVPFLTIPKEDIEKFELLWRVFSLEMETNDNLQMEMLQMMLKRLIIICTRLYREQRNIIGLPEKNMDIIREFNYLVEVHFRSKHTVKEYADMLNKSPKTLSNLFIQYSKLSPVQIIQERIMLEARRLLRYTDMPVKEIAFEVGYEDIQTFSRFFRSKEGIGPKEFREQKGEREKLITHQEDQPTIV